MGSLFPFEFNVRAALDTTNPESDRAPGVLRVAEGLHHRWWGPHRGPKVFAYPDDGLLTTKPGPGHSAYRLAATDFAEGTLHSKEQRDLGVYWTLDLWLFNWLGETPGSDATIFRWEFDGTFNAILVSVVDSTDVTDGLKVKVVIKTTNPAGTVASTITLLSTTLMSALENAGYVVIRVVRDGNNAYLYLQGELEDTDTTLLMTEPHEAASSGKWILGKNGENLDVVCVGARLLSVADRDTPFCASPPSICHSDAVKLYIGGYTRVGLAIVDYSKYHAHGSFSLGTTVVNGLTNFAIPRPVNGLGAFVDYRGRGWNFVCTGGTLLYERSDRPLFEYLAASALNQFGALQPGIHPFARMSMYPAGKYLLFLNGEDINRRTYDPEDMVYQPMQIMGADIDMTPATNGAGAGRVFGRDYVWRMRYFNSKTGEASGLSALGSTSINLGSRASDTSEDWVGESAFFEIPGVTHLTLTSDRPGVDRIQVFRNASENRGIWFLVADVENPGGGNTVQVIDDTPDEELDGAETAGLIPGFAYNRGSIPPVCHATLHPTGRTVYYGQRRAGPYRRGTVTLNKDSRLATGTDTFWLQGMAQRAFRLLKDSVSGDIDDTTIYRIIEVNATGNEILVDPPFKENGSMTSGLLVDATYEIIDDRDLRRMWFSEANLPTAINPDRAVDIGFFKDDPLFGVFVLDGTTYAITRDYIYLIYGDGSEDPNLTMKFQIKSHEGCAGLYAWAITPFGLVYYNAELGVRIFNGQVSVPCGQTTVFEDFYPRTQINNISEAYKGQTMLVWDRDERMLYVSYVPAGQTCPTEVLAFDPATGAWRGPWRISLFQTGRFLKANGLRFTAHGDDRGNLYRMAQQGRSMIPTTTGLTLSGTPTMEGGVRATLTPNNLLNEDSVVGVPVVFRKADSSRHTARVIGAFSATDVLLDVGSNDVDGNYTYYIGAISWYLETAYVDLEPIQPKKAEKIRFRFDRGGSNQSFTVGISADADGTFQGGGIANSEVETDPTDTIYSNAELQVGEARAFVFRAHGVAGDTGPKITKALIDTFVMEGQ